jgi:fluoroacetyl-CoA thioesterase
VSIAIGLTGEARRLVTSELTARALGSGDVDVFGTPALLAMIEEAALTTIASELAPEQTSVGMTASVEHLAPSRVGAEVRAVARVTAVDGRRVSFEAEAFDGETVIGRATHVRAIVDRARFA